MRLEPSFLVGRNRLPLNIFWHPIVKGGSMVALKILGLIAFMLGLPLVILFPFWLYDAGKWKGPR